MFPLPGVNARSGVRRRIGTVPRHARLRWAGPAWQSKRQIPVLVLDPRDSQFTAQYRLTLRKLDRRLLVGIVSEPSSPARTSSEQGSGLGGTTYHT